MTENSSIMSNKIIFSSVDGSVHGKHHLAADVITRPVYFVSVRVTGTNINKKRILVSIK